MRPTACIPRALNFVHFQHRYHAVKVKPIAKKTIAHHVSDVVKYVHKCEKDGQGQTHRTECLIIYMTIYTPRIQIRLEDFLEKLNEDSK